MKLRLWLVVVPVVLLVGAQVPGQDAKQDQEKIQGNWLEVAGEVAGKKIDIGFHEAKRFTFTKGKLTRSSQVISTKGGKKVIEYQAEGEGQEYKMDPTKTPKEIDFGKTRALPAIYSLEGDTLKICYAGPDYVRPKELTTQGKAGGFAMRIFKRDKN